MTSDAWSGPDAVLNRIEWAKQVGARMPPTSMPRPWPKCGMGPLLQPATQDRDGAAPKRQGDALALLLSSPEFQRR